MSLKTYQVAPNLDEEIKDFEGVVQQFKAGEITPTEFKVVRVPFGVYEQRKLDTYMIRIRCGGACVKPSQLKKIAETSNKHAADYIHLTTRQEIQLHYALVDNIIPVMHDLKSVGMASRGGGGNTIRNIMAADDAGINEQEAFDVTPYAISLTSRLVAEPDSWNLPRKFKITFSGISDDCNHATIHDIGYIAQEKDGKKGFKVYIAGGLGAKTNIGHCLFDFIPEEEVYNVAKATKNLFYKNGNRKNKHASRLRFLWKTLGEEEFLRKWHEEYEAVKKEKYPPLELDIPDNTAVDPGIKVDNPSDENDYKLWRQRFVRKQKQKGQFAVVLPMHLGHVDNEKAIALAGFLEQFGENTIRISKDQNFLIRNIPEKYLPNLYNFLKVTFDHFNRPYIIDKVIACAGASTCQLGICLSPGAATATKRELEFSDIDLDAVADAKVNISGCPNSCGAHHASDLGFFGKVKRVGDNVIPSYNVMLGAKLKDGETELAKQVGEIPARDLPSLVQNTFRTYIPKKDKFNSFNDYVRSEEGVEDIKEICKTFKDIPDQEGDINYYRDWGTDKLFSVAERGKGECSAGIFDLIEMDLGNLQQSRKLIDEINENGGSSEQKSKLLKELVFYSSRVLLVTRAVQPKNEKESYKYFREYFINGDLVDASADELIKIAESGDTAEFLDREEEVFALATRMKRLYDVMTPGFEFKLEDDEHIKNAEKVAGGGVVGEATSKAPAASEVKQEESGADKPDLVKDYRGVACPMNFVKTKMELAKLQKNQRLEIWLDDGEPIDNVPGSVRSEGHKILDQKKTNGYWTVLIEKQ